MEPFASPSTDSLYDGKYFLRYNVGAELGCEINKAHFMPYLKPSDRVLDFGCAGGDLLNALRVAEPVGVEINPAAIELARKLGIEVYPDPKTVPSASVDALISNHALEHVEQPLDVMREMIRTLKPDKLAVIVVPCDRVDVAYSPQDLDHHLYSWSASNLGNMARAAGFEIIEVSELVHRLPPLWHRFPSLWQNLYRVFGRRVFDPICRICALLRRDRTQVRLVARKPKLIEQVSS
ncbi:MAG: class I SAM-dependent methyltransferase [Alphaproteobacteria bacterium]|nr:class I SAM-dependent methyltransferase [Alphaproteobacteria bacterium]